MLVYLACNKSGSKQKKDDVSLTTGKKLDITVNKQVLENGKVRPGDTDPCLMHGGSVGIGLSWHLATCRTNCNHGIGFRCGRETYIICKDGTHIEVSQSMGNCPNASTSKDMSGTFTFYNNNTAKIFFATDMISREAGNTTFEVEDTETIDLPSYILIGGAFYGQIRVLPNNYHINYSDGSHGSVTLAVQYVP
jgi:hypothetical protein